MRPAAENSEAPSWLRLEHFFQRFEAAWQSEPDPDLDAFLPPPDSPDRTAVLLELVKIDLEYRWRRGAATHIETYLNRHPELNDGNSFPGELLAEEIRVRREHQAMPTGAELAERFPGRMAEVNDLLACAQEKSAKPVQPRQERNATPAATPSHMGRFELREQVGRGGFATVYRGWDSELRREVAIKAPHEEFLDSPEANARVLREAQSAARLRHPGIVPLFEVGQENGQTFLVYEFIPGPTLSRVLKETRPAPAQVAEWVMHIAEALEYAHQNGIVHRDVKPANVILDHGAQPRLADFGLALQADARATLTQEGDLLGTPAYMSPEQASGQRHAVDARSDVYSLGVMLYEGLCGRLPFQGSSVSVLHQVLHDEPMAPRAVLGALPADLETICLKAMAKEPARRYASAGALADDLNRYMNHRPIAARRVGPAGRLARWCRRKPALAATIALATVITLTVAGFSFHQVIQERDRFRAEKERAEDNLYHALVGQAKADLRARDTGWWWNVMDKVGQAARLDVAARDPRELRDLAVECMGSAYPCFRLKAAWAGHTGPVRTVALAPEGLWAASGGKDQTVRLWHVPTGTSRAVLVGHQSGVTSVAFHPNGKQLASGSADGTVRLWKIAPAEARQAEQPEQVLDLQAGPVHQVTMAPDGRWFAAACGNATVQVIALSKTEDRRILKGHTGPVQCLGFDGQSKLLATGSSDHTIRFWDVATGAEVAAWNTNYPISSLAFAPSGHTVAWSDRLTFGIGQANPLSAPTEHGTLHQDAVNQVIWDRFGRILTASADGMLKAWTSFPPRELAVAGSELGPAWCLAAATTGDAVAAGYQDGQVRLWQLAEPPHRSLWMAEHAATFLPRARTLYLGHHAADFSHGPSSVSAWQSPEGVFAVAAHPTENTILLARSQGDLEIWDRKRRELVRRWRGHEHRVTSVAVHPDGRSAVSADSGGGVVTWDWGTQKPGQRLAADLGAVHQVAWSSAGKYLAAVGERGAGLWSNDGNLLWRRHHRFCSSGALAFGPDFLAIAEPDGSINICDPRTGVQQRKLTGHKGAVTALACSPERVLASAGHDKTLRLWDAGAGLEQALLRFDVNAPTWLAFAPRGNILASGGDASTTMIWDLQSNAPLCHIIPERDSAGCFTPHDNLLLLGSARNGIVRVCAEKVWEATRQPAQAASGSARVDVYDWVVPGGHVVYVWGNAASPDGRWVATAGHDRTAKIWDARTRRLVHTLEGHNDLVWCVAFSPDSKYVASGSAQGAQGEIRLWDVETGKEVQRLQGHKRLVVGLAFHPSAPWLVSASLDGSVLGWETPSGKPLGVLHQFDQAVHQIAIDPRGHWLAAACHDHHVALWNVQQAATATFAPRAPDKTLAGHAHAVWALAFSPGGDYLASASENGLIIFWDGETHEQRLRLRSPSSRLRSLTFSHDARLLAAGGLAERTIVWDLDHVRRTLQEMNLDW